MLKKTMDEITPLWGICPFDKIENELIPCRAKSRLPENAKTIIVACFPYLLKSENYKDINISKYAAVTDYHSVVLDRLDRAVKKLKELYPDEKFAAFADNSPIPEVDAACLADLGVRGLNTLLITAEYGSYVFIGEIVTTLDIPASAAVQKGCTECRKCVDTCPSGALSEGGFDKERCLSHITQKKGILTPDEEKLMRECGCVWGCDICQDVCPMNKNAKTTQIEEFLSSPIARIASGCELDSRAYEWRGRNVIERNLALHNK